MRKFKRKMKKNKLRKIVKIGGEEGEEIKSIIEERMMIRRKE